MVFITETEYVYCPVRAEYFYIIQVNIRLQSSLCHSSGRVVGLSPHRPPFNPWSAHVTFLVYEVALRQAFLPALRFYLISVIPPLLYTHRRLNVALTGRTNDRSLEAFKKAIFFRQQGSSRWKSTFTSFLLQRLNRCSPF